MKIYCLIGHPVKHSLSPAMQNAAFKASGIDAEYKAFDIVPEGLEDFLRTASSKGILGLNITIPHKIMAAKFLEREGSLDEMAKRLGAVNTINILDGKLKGFNTDGAGFYRSLVEDLHFEPEGKTILVLGAGGAASAIVMYLGNGPKKVYIHDVDDKKARDLETRFKKYYDEKRVAICFPGDLAKCLGEAELLINGTPLGMNEKDDLPVDPKLLHQGLSIYDLVYNVPMTRLVKEASRKKIRSLTGMGMLLYQGALAYEIWTLRKAPVDVMKRALREALRG